MSYIKGHYEFVGLGILARYSSMLGSVTEKCRNSSDGRQTLLKYMKKLLGEPVIAYVIRPLLSTRGMSQSIHVPDVVHALLILLTFCPSEGWSIVMSTKNANAVSEQVARQNPLSEAQAVAIATANLLAEQATKAEAVAIATAKADARLSMLAYDLEYILASGDADADATAEAVANAKVAYGKITEAVSGFLKPLVMEDVAPVVALYLNRLSGKISKHAMTSRKKTIVGCFAKSFEGYTIDFEFSKMRGAYEVAIATADSAETKAELAFMLAFDKYAKFEGVKKQDILDMIDAYYN